MTTGPCDLCGSADAAPVVVGRRFGREAPFVLCRRCGLMFQHPRPADAELQAFYRDEYRTLYSGDDEPSTLFVDDQRRRGDAVLQRVRDAGVPMPTRVLDVGCAAGAALLPFRDAGCEVVGIEPGPFGAWGARQLGLDIRPVSDLAKLSDAEPFGLVMLTFVLEHVASPFDVLADVNRLVAGRGQVYVEVPNLLSAAGTVEEYFHVAHLTYFSPATLRAMLEAAGFRSCASSAGRTYSMWEVARASAPARRPDRWSGPPLDNPMDATARLARQRRVALVEGAARSAVKPLLVAGQATVRRMAGDDAAARYRDAARHAWLRLLRRR